MVEVKTYKKEFCLNCHEENPQDQEICKCGGRNFVFGDKINIVDKKVVCDCGGEDFKMTFHINGTPVYNRTYKCTNVNCGASFGVQNYFPYLDHRVEMGDEVDYDED